jgi:hypothetical protein
MFAFGCILAELFLGKPLFSPASLLHYARHPEFVPDLHVVCLTIICTPFHFLTQSQLPTGVEGTVRALIDREWRKRPRASELLASPVFPTHFRELYAFLAKFHSLRSWPARLDFTLDHIARLVHYIPSEVLFLSIYFVSHFTSFIIEFSFGSACCGPILFRRRNTASFNSPLPTTRS